MKHTLYILLFFLFTGLNAQKGNFNQGISSSIGRGVGFGSVSASNTADTIAFQSIQPATIDQVSITFQTLTNQDTVYLDWGDGSAVVKVSGTTDQTKTSAYVTNNTTYNIKVYGDLTK